MPLILTYLELIHTDGNTLSTVTNYLDFIVARASGELMSPATWMRKFVQAHPDYKGDSVRASLLLYYYSAILPFYQLLYYVYSTTLPLYSSTTILQNYDTTIRLYYYTITRLHC